MYILADEPKGSGTLTVAFEVLDGAFGTEEFSYADAIGALDNSEVPSPKDTLDRLVNGNYVSEV